MKIKLVLLAALFALLSFFVQGQEYASQQELVGDKFEQVKEKSETKSDAVEKAKLPVIEIKGDWIYVDGERYFIKGVGYSGWRPHQLPWQERPKPELVENDFRLIRDAGFNTIRTWSALNSSELALTQKYDLMVMQGIFVDPSRDYASPVYQNYVVTIIKNQVKYFVDEPSILMYLVANEPPVERVRTSGIQNTEKVLQLMVDTVRQLDPTKIVTFSNWVQLAFINHSMLPVVAYNVYMYEPDIVKYALTYKGYLEWLKNNTAQNKPFIVAEFGLSVSAYGSGNYGRGGNTEEEQRDGTIQMYEDIISSGATGGCVFEWNDEWWKNYDYSGDQHKHETSDPEEWYGILEIKDETSELTGRPRLIYEGLKKYQQALIINPKDVDFYSGPVLIELYATPKVKKIFHRIDNAIWNGLEQKSAHWWQTSWDSAKAKNGKHILEIKALDEADMVLGNKKRVFWINNDPDFVRPFLKVTLATDKQKYICSDKMEKLILTITVTDQNAQPVAEIPVDYAFYESRFWQNLHGNRLTDEKGQIEIEYLINESGFINIGAGATLTIGEYSRRFGDVIAVEVEKIQQPKQIMKTEETGVPITKDNNE